MTVLLRKMESLGRSCRQSLWRCGVGAGGTREANLGIDGYRTKPRASSSYPRSYYGCHSFSTSSTGDDIRPEVAVGPPSSVPHVLEVASSEARRVISRAPRRSSSPTVSSSPREAVEAAQAMMALTSPTKSLAEAILANKTSVEQVACLHKAFLAVTSWCISLVSMETSLVDCGLDLARRAHDLSLPLHLPLYRSLATAIAKHSDDEVVDAILETANLAVSALHVTLEGSFFSDAILCLVEKKQISQAIELRTAIKDRYDVERLDNKAELEILNAITRDIGISGGGKGLEDLCAMFSKPDLDQLLSQSWTDSSEELFENYREALREASFQLDSSSDDEFDSSDDEFDSSDDEFYETKFDDEMMEFDEYERNTERITQETLARLRHIGQKTFAIRKKLSSLQGNDETGDIEHDNVAAIAEENESSDEETGDDITKEMVYLRDSRTWILPDVTHQLVQLNGGRKVFYTRDYEWQIFREVIDNYGGDDS